MFLIIHVTFSNSFPFAFFTAYFMLNIYKINFFLKKVEKSGGKWGFFCTFAVG